MEHSHVSKSNALAWLQTRL